MTKVTSSASLTREAMPDAPDGQWLDSLLEKTNLVDDQLIKTLQGGFSITDNTPWKFVSLNLQHGVEVEVKNPFDNPAMPVKMISIAQATGLVVGADGRPTGSTFNIAQPTLSWRPSGKPSNSVFVSANYDSYLAHSFPYSNFGKSSSQSISNNVTTAVTWDTTGETVGSIISITSGSRITVSEAGRYAVFATVRWAANTAGNRWIWIRKNGLLGFGVFAKGELCLPPNGGINPPFYSTSTVIKLGAGEFCEVDVFQDSGGSLNITGGIIDEPCIITIQRLYNDTIPTASVKMLFQGA